MIYSLLARENLWQSFNALFATQSFMLVLAQTWPLVFTKALSADPLVLLLFVVFAVIIVALIIMLVWLVATRSQARRAAHEDDRWDKLFEFFTDADSPMVQNVKQTTKAIEQGNERSNELTQAVKALKDASLELGKKTDAQTTEVTGELKGLRQDSSQFQMLVSSDLSQNSEILAANTASIQAVVATVNGAMTEIRMLVGQRTYTPDDLEARLQRFKTDFFAELGNYVKRVTTQTEKIVIPPTAQSEVPNSSADKPDESGS